VRVLALFSLLFASALAGVVQAQQTPSASANAIGIVFDSVRMRPMVGARVRVDTTNLVAEADANGRFHIEGIPPGAHYLRVEHPVLDTMGIALRSPSETYDAGETKLTELATPEQPNLVGILCSAAWRARGPAALMGRVWEADSGEPATGAKVSLVWYELDMNSGGLRKAPRVREASVTADGSYRICGLPAQVEGRLQVIRGAMTSGDIPISFGQDVLALRSMSIAAPGAVATAPPTPGDSARPTTQAVASPRGFGTARLTGRVLNKTGAPLVGARVQVEGTTRAATTRPTGDFSLDSLPSGTQTVSVRLLGYAPVEKAVDLSSRESQSVTVTMDNFVPVLEAVRVNAQREKALDDVGFVRRKRTGQGYYMDAEQIKQRSSQNFSDVMRGAPGIRVSQSMNRQVIQSSRDPNGGCVNIWIDGSQWQQMEPGDVDDFVKPHELGAIEVYSPTTTPPEYAPAGRSSCSTIVAWTNRRLDRKR
jgi:hypothetical protein